MKKLLSLVLALLMLLGMMTIPAMASENVKVYLFGEKLEFDVPAQIVNGRTLVPMRKIFEELGYTVEWEKAAKTAIAVSAERTIRITENSYTMYVNDEEKTLDVPAQIIDGRTLVPARAISEASGYKVDWDKNTKSVLITLPTATDSALDKRIIAEMGDIEVSEAFYNCCYYPVYSRYAEYAQYFGENWLDEDSGYGMTIGEMIVSEAQSEVERLAMGAAIAKKIYGITPADVRDMVDYDINETIRSYKDRNEFDAFLAEIKTTEKGLRTYFEMTYVYALLLENTLEDGKAVSVTEAEAEAVFKEEFGNKMKVQHILITTESLDGYTPARTDAEAMAIANNVLKELKKGTDFGLLISTYNEDPGQTPDGFYVFGEGEMVQEFEDASKKLAVGKYTTQPVKSDYGYHIIKRYPLDKTSEEFEEFRMYFAYEKLTELIAQELKKANIKWNN